MKQSVAIKCVKTEYAINPIGVETQTPRFSWEYEMADGLLQTEYRVVVSSTYKDADDGNGDKWDSGIVRSRDCIGIEYGGKPLESGELCFVKVFVNTTVGDAASAVYTFEMGLFYKDWVIAWRSCPLTAAGSAIVFRRNFVIPKSVWGKQIDRARAYVCAIGYHEFYINGAKVGKGLMNPVISDFNKRIYYNIYDVTQYVQEKNAIGVLAGNGWFGQPRVTVNLIIYFKDGTKHAVVTGEHERWWRARKSPIVAGTVFDGETYDARIEDELVGWSEYNEKFGLDNGWYFGVPQKHDKEIVLVSQKIPEIGVEEEIAPVGVRHMDGYDVYDFGRNLTGRLKIEVSGERGAKVTMRFAEMVDENGNLNRGSLRNAINTDTYVLAGRESESYAPHFSYRGFRYAEVKIEGKVAVNGIIAQRLRTLTRQAGEFECSDEYLNRLHVMSARTEACNHHGILTDCPQRDERMGWLNDLSSRLFQTCNNYGMETFFEKITDDITDTMDASGAIKDTAPYYLGGNVADPVSVAYLLIGKFAYERYGDLKLIKDNFDNYQKWVAFLTEKTKDGVLPLGIYGDWVPAISVVPYASRRFNKGFPIELISTMSLLWHYKLCSQLAQYIGRAETSRKYAEMAEKTKKIINEKFYDRQNGRYCADVQSGNAMALSLSVADECERARLLDNIIGDLQSRDWHFTCGNQSYRHLIGVLAENGRNDVVLKILQNKQYPSWGYMLENGATTVWERWEAQISSTEENMHSYCHPMFGSYDYWFYQHLAGIKVKDGMPAMYDFEISPWVTPEVERVNCSVTTLLGEICVRYQIKGEVVEYEITVPSNCTARVVLPGQQECILKAGTHTRQGALK